MSSKLNQNPDTCSSTLLAAVSQTFRPKDKLSSFTTKAARRPSPALPAHRRCSHPLSRSSMIDFSRPGRARLGSLTHSCTLTRLR
jgi:hypothetical protein